MRIKIKLDVKNMTLPYNYYYILQSMIYRNLPEDIATILHNSTSYKNFNFSRLLGRSFVNSIKETNNNIITFLGDAVLYISSNDQNMLLMLMNVLMNKRYIILGHYIAPILSVEEFYMPIKSKKTYFRTINPVTVHETINGKTIYYNPLENKFFDLLNRNYSRKIGSKDKDLLKFSNIRNINKVVSKYKDIIIEGYDFEFNVEGEIEDIENLLSLGLGDRNSQGYGMIEKYNR